MVLGLSGMSGLRADFADFLWGFAAFYSIALPSTLTRTGLVYLRDCLSPYICILHTYIYILHLVSGSTPNAKPLPRVLSPLDTAVASGQWWLPAT